MQAPTALLPWRHERLGRRAASDAASEVPTLGSMGCALLAKPHRLVRQAQRITLSHDQRGLTRVPYRPDPGAGSRVVGAGHGHPRHVPPSRMPGVPYLLNTRDLADQVENKVLTRRDDVYRGDTMGSLAGTASSQPPAEPAAPARSPPPLGRGSFPYQAWLPRRDLGQAITTARYGESQRDHNVTLPERGRAAPPTASSVSLWLDIQRADVDC
jgi:hypothetical protein